ncbi:MAG: hypothetical protein ACFFD2_09850 [Promethearchaeota archaeon]
MSNLPFLLERMGKNGQKRENNPKKRALFMISTTSLRRIKSCGPVQFTH